MYDSTTVMRFVVNVPVLSEQIAVAFPIVSHASKCRTRLWSFIIFCSHTNSQLRALDAGISTTANQAWVIPATNRYQQPAPVISTHFLPAKPRQLSGGKEKIITTVLCYAVYHSKTINSLELHSNCQFQRSSYDSHWKMINSAFSYHLGDMGNVH